LAQAIFEDFGAMPSLPEGRFYEAEFPALEEIVVVKVTRIQDTGAYVQLLEYDNKEGMLLLSEITKRRVRSYTKLLRVGRTEISMVVKMDVGGPGYIDLSKRKVTPEQAAAKEDSFSKAKAVHSIMRHVASLHEIKVEELCMKVSWPLHKKYGSAYEAFRQHIDGERSVWDELDFSRPGKDLSAIGKELKQDIETHLRRRLQGDMLRLRAKVEVSCAEFEGVDAVREALLQGYRASTEGCEVKIHLVACPLFVLSCTCRDKEFGIQRLQESADLIKECILSKGGEFELRAGPGLAGLLEDNDILSDVDNQDDLSPGSFSDNDEKQDETMCTLTEEQESELTFAEFPKECRDSNDSNIVVDGNTRHDILSGPG